MTYKYEEAVSSLLHKFQKNNFSIVAVDDFGGDIFAFRDGTKSQIRQDAVNAICAVDQSRVALKNSNGNLTTLFIVLDTNLDEIVCDYSYDRAIEDQVEEIVVEFQDQWEGKKYKG